MNGTTSSTDRVLGISCYYHDAAACLVVDGAPVAAAEEERFTRQKHDNSFPEHAIRYCLDEAGIDADDLDKVVFYEKPIQKFDRLLNTAAAVFPRGFPFFSRALPEWVSTKLRVRHTVRKTLDYDGPVECVPHHLSHAASAFYPSPFDAAAVLTVDGVGEWVTNQLFAADETGIEPLQEIRFPDSIGLLYSTITAYLGFMVNNDEYKVMGLASYGDPTYRSEFTELIDIDADGSYTLDQDYFAYQRSARMYSDALPDLLGEPRAEGAELTQRHKDIAATLQDVLEEVLLKQVHHLYELTETENLCMAGGVALNSAANGRIRQEMPFDNIWIQPAAGDDGGALGAALHRTDDDYTMTDVYLGPEYGREAVLDAFDAAGASYETMDAAAVRERAAELLADGKVVSLYQGRLEWGPRALGNRSIMADPRREEMMDRVNEKVKFREEFRPFAPTVLADHADDYFDIDGESPYMLFVFDVHDDKQDEIPAVTHVNGTSRIQTVTRETNPFYYNLIDRFREETGVPVILNTSFNLKGMPIVNTPEQAYDVFDRSGIDRLITPYCIVDG